MFETLLGLIHLILFIWAVINIWQSRATVVMKFVWSAVVFLFPLVGLIIWFFVGPKKG